MTCPLVGGCLQAGPRPCFLVASLWQITSLLPRQVAGQVLLGAVSPVVIPFSQRCQILLEARCLSAALSVCPSPSHPPVCPSVCPPATACCWGPGLPLSHRLLGPRPLVFPSLQETVCGILACILLGHKQENKTEPSSWEISKVNLPSIPQPVSHTILHPGSCSQQASLLEAPSLPLVPPNEGRHPQPRAGRPGLLLGLPVIAVWLGQGPFPL